MFELKKHKEIFITFLYSIYYIKYTVYGEKLRNTGPIAPTETVLTLHYKYTNI